jgi:very-short-patch-repair endonuclease
MLPEDLSKRVAGYIAQHNTHATLAEECINAGLDVSVNQDGLSKFQRARAILASNSPEKVAHAAEIVGRKYRDLDLEEAGLRLLESRNPPITEITRRELARCFDPPSLFGERDPLDMLRKLWPIDVMETEPFGPSLAEKIHRHMVRNDDWAVDQLWDYLGAFSCSTTRLIRLLEAVVHPLARRGKEQEELCRKLNEALSRDGYRLEIADYESGFPIFRAISLRTGVSGRPKNLIFASRGPKPQIGFSDAINNDIVILSNSESCLVYDRAIPSAGLLWDEIAEWWRAEHCSVGVTAEDARKSLGARLRESLGSDAERNLFASYFRIYRDVLGARLPALIPQVYLHYDPTVLKQLAHRSSIPRQRMDFLLLLDQRARVVIEVDGKHHFSKEDKPSLPAYSEMVREDRKLRLLGYEVYRFGANELVGPDASSVVSAFFNALFRNHHVLAT